MDYLTHTDSSKYVISLDSLDMGLLPTYTARPNNSASLWTANLNRSSKDYFEFLVKPKTDTDMFDDDDSTMNNESTNSINETQSNRSTPKQTHREDTTTICHICDIDLPAAYLVDHENSLKHKAYVKITDVVLNRSRKQILKKSIGYTQKDYSTYFCGPCASEVKLDTKHNHEKSKTHKKSVSLDRVLYELATLYTDHEYEESCASNTSDDEKFIKNEVDAINNEIEENTVVISDIEARLEEFETKTIENHTKMVHEFDLDKLYVLSNVGNDLKISMDGCEVIVAQDNFNGLIWIDENHKFCMMCKIIVEQEKTHKLSEAHMKSIAKPFKDHNFIRNLDNSRSHCVICNKIVNDTNFHVLCDKTHIELLQKSLVDNENKPKTIQKDPVINTNNQVTRTETGIIHNGLDKESDNSSRLLQSIVATKPKMTTKSELFTKIDNETYLCNACNLELHVNNIESHGMGNKHAINSKSIVHYNMMKGIGSVDLFCRVCNVYVADEVDEVKAHVATKDHAQKYTDLLANNHVIQKQGNFYCKPCDLVVLKRNELYHIEKLTHETNLASFKALSVKLNSTENTNTCKSDSNAALHAVDNSSNKTNLESNINQPISKDSKPTDVTGYYCDICQVKVPNNPNNIRSHNEGGRHRKNLLKKEEEVADSIEDSECLEVHHHMDITDNEKSLMCKVCKVVVPNTEDGINEHVRGKKHDAAFKILMDTNHIESVGEKYFCKFCNVDIKTHNIFKHINQKKHLALLGNVEKPETAAEVESLDLQTKIDTKDKEIDKNTIDVSKESIDALYLKFKHHFVESEDKEWLKCKICFDMDIPNTVENVAIHAGGKAHMDEYNNILSSNLIFETEDRRYFCAICDCYIPLTGEVNHAKGNRHTGNFAIYLSRETCSICDVDTTSTNMPEHVMSPEHVSNVLVNEPLVNFCPYCKLIISKDSEEGHANICHKFAVKDKICFCTQCDPYLPST